MTTMSIEQRKNLREELNEAIYTVITTQYKKDAKEAHEIVSAFGYEIYKYDGRFRVCNKATSKVVYVCSQSYRYRRFDLGNKVAEQTKDKNSICFNPCRVDFVGYLDKPFNREYYDMRNNSYRRHSRAVSKFHDLKDAKRDIEYYGEQIDRIKAQIAHLEDDMLSYARRQMNSEQSLRRLRCEYHLA